MTDLFASLVDRALDRAPVLRRRQPTLFEPVAENPFGEQANTANALPIEEKEIVVESRPHPVEQRDSASSFLTLPQPPSRLEEQEPSEARPTRPRRLHDSPQNDEDNDPTPPASIREPAGVTRTQAPNSESKPAPVVKPAETTITPPRLIETIVEKRVEREIVKEPSASQPPIKEVQSFTQLNEQPKPSRKNEATESKQPLKAEVKQLTRPKEPVTIKPLIQQKPAPRREPPPITRAATRAEARHSSKQATPPAIHVTIGRVEVRATPAATGKTRTAQPAAPKMSLEDYLQSRGEGKK